MATLRYFQVVVNFGSLPQPPQTQKKTPNEQHESHLVQKLEMSPNHSGTPIPRGHCLNPLESKILLGFEATSTTLRPGIGRRIRISAEPFPPWHPLKMTPQRWTKLTCPANLCECKFPKLVWEFGMDLVLAQNQLTPKIAWISVSCEVKTNTSIQQIHIDI